MRVARPGRIYTAAGCCGGQSRHDREGVTCGAGECERCYDGVYRVVTGVGVAVSRDEDGGARVVSACMDVPRHDDEGGQWVDEAG